MRKTKVNHACWQGTRKDNHEGYSLHTVDRVFTDRDFLKTTEDERAPFDRNLRI
jgi:hypothetical protein